MLATRFALSSIVPHLLDRSFITTSYLQHPPVAKSNVRKKASKEAGTRKKASKAKPKKITEKPGSKQCAYE